MILFVGYEAAPWLLRARRAAQAWRNVRWFALGLTIGALLTACVCAVRP